MRVRVRACVLFVGVSVCVRACMNACMRACMHACVRGACIDAGLSQHVRAELMHP